MNALSSHSRACAPLAIESDIFVTVNNIGFQVKADGNYVVLSGNVLRVLLGLKKNNGVLISAVFKAIESAEKILRHIDINICLYNKRFAVLGTETKPFINWARSLVVRYFERY